MENVSPVTPTAPAPTPAPATNGQDPVPASVKPRAPRKPRAAKKAAPAKRGGARLFSDSAKITIVLKGKAEVDKKRRPGTNGRKFWGIYKTGMTVGTALKKGAELHDLRWCVKKGFITLK